MEISDIILTISSFIPLRDILNMRLVSKTFNEILSSSSFYNLRFGNGLRGGSYYSGPYFSFPNPYSYIDSISVHESCSGHSITNLKRLLNMLTNPASLILKPIEASSTDYDQGIERTLSYEDHSQFWSSKSNESPDTDEYLIYQLKQPSVVFTVNFQAYRAFYQGGVVYPPRSVKVRIGNSPRNFHYESQEFPVEVTEKYNTIFILPDLVKGEFVRIDLIGKQMREPGTERFYSVVDFVEIIGFDANEIGENYEINPDKLEDLIKIKDFDRIRDRIQNFATPFYYERMLKHNILEELISILPDNQMKDYFFVKKALENSDEEKLNTILADVIPREIIGDILYEKGKFEYALSSYNGCRDFWGSIKVLLKLNKMEILKNFLQIDSVRVPKFNDILRVASKLGPEYEKKVIEELRN